MPKAGRPSIYSDKIAEDILDRLSNGESLVAICKDPKMPGLRTVLRWAGEREDFGTEYARAREAQAEHMDDLIVETAKKAGDDPQGARVKVDAYKWRAAKLAPKKYGDLLKLGNADGTNIAPEVDEATKMTRLAAIVAAVRQGSEESQDG